MGLLNEQLKSAERGESMSSGTAPDEPLDGAPRQSRRQPPVTARLGTSTSSSIDLGIVEVQNELKLRFPSGRPRPVFERIISSPQFEYILLASILVWASGALLLEARSKLFWYDELLTFHVSGLQPFSLLWKALLAGADGMPPGYYMIVRLARMIPGDPHVILRLPSIIGYLLTLLGVYWFARRRLPAAAGLAAVILVTLSHFREYAIEARSYALLVGFLAIAAVCWQRFGERWFMAPLFAISLALAVACHPLAVVAISIFATAELAWTVLSRRIRWGMWASCLLATCPFFMGLPILLKYRESFGKSFWSRPTWNTAYSTYGLYLGFDPLFTLALIVLIMGVIGSVVWRLWQRRRGGSRDRDFSLPELILVAAFILYPALLVTLAKTLHSGYVDRYGWPAIFGLVLGTVYLFCAMGVRSAPTRLLIGLLIPFAVIARFEFKVLAKTTVAARDERWTKLAQLSRDNPDLPVVIGNGTRYLEAVEYASIDLRERLVEADDPDIANQLDGHDTVEKTNRILAEFIPLRIEGLGLFQAKQRRFIYYSQNYVQHTDWVTAYLMQEKYHLTLLSQVGAASIFMVER